MNNRISLAINIVLAIAVAVLFYFQFAGNKDCCSAKMSNLPINKGAAELKAGIVYINTDTLLAHFDYYQEQKKQLVDRKSKLEGDLNNRATQLQKEAQGYQSKAQSMTQEQMQMAEQTLMMKQQELVKMRDDRGMQLAEAEQKLTEDIFKKLSDYLQELNKQSNYTYILGYSKGGGILLANDKLEITKVVLEGLNAKYPGTGKK